MQCPFCGNNETQVKDSRVIDEDVSIKRRRYCQKCDSRFTTFERVQLKEIVVVKKNLDKKLFDPEKLKKSIEMAVRKRPVTQIQTNKLANNIIRQIELSGESEIKTQKIGELVMDSLKNLDKVAFVRFASVYKNFKSTQDFKDFIQNI